MRRHAIAGRVVCDRRTLPMLDAILIAAGIGFFVIAVLYVVACDKM